MGKIVIMGATSGLGLALARKFLDADWQVGAAGRNINALENLKTYSPNCKAFRAIDINREGSERELLDLFDEMNGVDIYLHCSGVLPDESDLDIDKEMLTVNTNAAGFTRMIATAYRYFKSCSNKSGHNNNNGKGAGPFRIAAISSIAGYRGLEALPAYSASKAYDSIYLEALRQRADGENLPLRIIDIRPGWTRTPLLASGRKYLFETDTEKVADRIFHTILHSKRGATILPRWKFITLAERLVPQTLWTKIHIPLWKD